MRRVFLPPRLRCCPLGWWPRRACWLGIALVLGLASRSPGQTLVAPAPSHYPQGVAVLSRSGQLIARSQERGLSPWPVQSLTTNQNYIELEPTLLSVSAERIKQELLRLLQTQDTWQGQIQVLIYPAQSADDAVEITSTRFRDGWQYQVRLPSILERVRYLRAMVQTLLLENANRHARTHSAELPPWLTEGLVQQLLAANEKEILLPPPSPGSANKLGMTVAAVNSRNQNALATAHALLESRQPLSYEELSWPTARQWSGTEGAFYRCNAQVFVMELLGQPQGPAQLRQLLAQLPQFYNWQLAFLSAFQSQFSRPLDVEKWWTLRVMSFTGHSLSQQTWPLNESWQKLHEALLVSIEVRTDLDRLPLSSSVSLQVVLQEWDRARQEQMLQQKLHELNLLRMRVAPPLTGLTEQYRLALQTFRSERDHAGLVNLFNPGKAQRRAVAAAVDQLNDLDRQLQALRPGANAPAPPQTPLLPTSPSQANGGKPQINS